MDWSKDKEVFKAQGKALANVPYIKDGETVHHHQHNRLYLNQVQSQFTWHIARTGLTHSQRTLMR
jgi:hypothetical protein